MSTTNESCWCSDAEIVAYIAGDLDDREQLDVATHLGECESCRDLAVDYTALGGVIDDCCAGDLIRWHAFDTPFGPMYVAATARGLARVSWDQADDDAFEAELSGRFPDRPLLRDPHAHAEAERQLREYFDGERSTFELPLDLESLTPFERDVLRAAREIPFGDVVPYAELARRIRRPKAFRAVGNALGHNPVAIVIPCHRVVRSDGGLGGYTGGVEYKRKLLALEGSSEYQRAG